MNDIILEGVKKLHSEMKVWMSHLHQRPELALQETETAGFLQKTKSWGFDVAEGIGKTGIVASMTVVLVRKPLGCVPTLMRCPFRR